MMELRSCLYAVVIFERQCFEHVHDVLLYIGVQTDFVIVPVARIANQQYLVQSMFTSSMPGGRTCQSMERRHLMSPINKIAFKFGDTLALPNGEYSHLPGRDRRRHAGGFTTVSGTNRDNNTSGVT